MRVSSIMSLIEKKIPKDFSAYSLIQEKLYALNDQQREIVYQKIKQEKLKSPFFVFWVGSFFLGIFGLGRFLIGDKVAGFAKIGLYLINFFLSIYINRNAEELSPENINNLVYMSLALSIAIYGWWIVDMILVGKKLRKQNFEKINVILDDF